MSSFAVTAERLIMHPHPDPAVDRIELAQVGEYRAVVPRGRYRTGDRAICIPEAAVAPDALLEELGLAGRLAGANKSRVKAMRLRGGLSQGLVCTPALLAGADLAAASGAGVDFAPQRGVSKWEPEVPAHLSGELIAAPELMPWIDIENIRCFPAMFAPGEPVVATEKIHGSATCVTWQQESGRMWVSSRGFAARRRAIAESQSNLYRRALRAFGVGQLLREVAASGRHAKVALNGEVYEGGYDYAALTALAEGRTRLGGEAHVREGVVVRACPERLSEVVNVRAIARSVGKGCLTRSGGSEYG